MRKRTKKKIARVILWAWGLAAIIGCVIATVVLPEMLILWGSFIAWLGLVWAIENA